MSLQEAEKEEHKDLSDGKGIRMRENCPYELVQPSGVTSDVDNVDFHQQLDH